MSIVTDEILKKATETLHGEQMYNCAQSVVALCGHVELCDEMKQCGGGRAPEGLCGALHAALLLVPEDKREEVRQAFALEAGAEKCRDIKGTTGTSCQMCVAIATALASKY